MSIVACANWRPSHKHNALELFEVPCSVGFQFYGPYGEQARVEEGTNEGIAIECLPAEREHVIGVLAELLELMKSVK